MILTWKIKVGNRPWETNEHHKVDKDLSHSSGKVVAKEKEGDEGR